MPERHHHRADAGPEHPAGVIGWLADRLAYVLLLAALVWAPVPLGGNRPWAMALLAALLWLALLLALAGRAAMAAASGSSAFPGRRAMVPLSLAAAFCGLVVLQLSAAASSNVGEGYAGTVDEYLTRGFLLRALAYAAAIALVALTVRSPGRCSGVLGALLAAGLLQAAVAAGLSSVGMPYTYLFWDFTPGRASGTFVNPDHLAGFMELTIAAGLGLLMSQFSSTERPSAANWRARVGEGLGFLMSRKMLLRLALVALVVGLVMTHSRGGNGAFFISLVVVGALVATMSQRLRRPALWLVASMVVVDVFVVGQLVGLERVVERLKHTAEASSEALATFGLDDFAGALPPPREESIEQRLQTPLLSLALVEQRPWLGHGGGTFALAFSPIKPDTINSRFWDHAHNDYVQVAVETGLVGLALWVGIGMATAWRAVRMLKDGNPRLNRGVGVAALMAISCLALHSVVDFNLYIPANALAFTVLLSLVWVVDGLPGQPQAQRQRGRGPLKKLKIQGTR